MQDTLKARLGRLQSLQGLADKLQVKVEEKEFSDAEVRILKEFYAQDQLAYAVASGKDSYRTRIQFIEEKYSTLWRRAFTPKKDEAFNQEVIRVLGSMNSVEEYICTFGGPCPAPALFTTTGRSKSIRGPNLLVLGVGGVFSLLAGSMIYYTPECYRTAIECYENVTDKTLMASFISMMLPMFYGMAKLIHGVYMNDELNSLRNAAQKTDEFLRKHYV